MGLGHSIRIAFSSILYSLQELNRLAVKGFSILFSSSVIIQLLLCHLFRKVCIIKSIFGIIIYQYYLWSFKPAAFKPLCYYQKQQKVVNMSLLLYLFLTQNAILLQTDEYRYLQLNNMLEKEFKKNLIFFPVACWWQLQVGWCL